MAQAAVRPPLTLLSSSEGGCHFLSRAASDTESPRSFRSLVPQRVSCSVGAYRSHNKDKRQVSRLHAVGSEQSALSEKKENAGSDTPHPSRPLQYGSRFERSMPEKSILQKAEDEMNEKCMSMEGEEAYECWQTVFEFEGDKAAAERECILAPPGEKQQACGPLESLQTLVREGSAQGVSAVLANIRASAQTRKARRLAEAKAKNSPSLVSGAARKTEADRAEFEVGGGRNKVEMAGGVPPRSEASGEEWENEAAAAAEEGMEDRLGRESSSQDGHGLSAVRRVLKKRGLSGVWLQERHE